MVGSDGSNAVYSFSDQAIESVDVVKDLGVLVDSKFNFFQHISDITKNTKILRCFLTRDPFVLIRAFKIYVRSLVEYASPVWSPCLLYTSPSPRD